jgi:hypothetical protein
VRGARAHFTFRDRMELLIRCVESRSSICGIEFIVDRESDIDFLDNPAKRDLEDVFLELSASHISPIVSHTTIYRLVAPLICGIIVQVSVKKHKRYVALRRSGRQQRDRCAHRSLYVPANTDQNAMKSFDDSLVARDSEQIWEIPVNHCFC